MSNADLRGADASSDHGELRDAGHSGKSAPRSDLRGEPDGERAAGPSVLRSAHDLVWLAPVLVVPGAIALAGGSAFVAGRATFVVSVTVYVVALRALWRAKRAHPGLSAFHCMAAELGDEGRARSWLLAALATCVLVAGAAVFLPFVLRSLHVVEWLTLVAAALGLGGAFVVSLHASILRASESKR